MGRNRMEIGLRIQELRETAGLSQADLAKEFDVRRETISQWENGTRDLKTEYTIKLAKYYNTTCDYILLGVKPNNVTVSRDLNLSDEAIEGLRNYGIGDIVSSLIEHAASGFWVLIRNYLRSGFNPIITEEMLKMLETEPVSIAMSPDISSSILVRDKDTGMLTTFPVKYLPGLYKTALQSVLDELRDIYQKTIKAGEK